MKQSITFLTITFLAAFALAQPTSKDFGKLKWLEGKWKRTNAKPGNSGFEIWTKISDAEWKGKGITLKGN